MTQRKFRILAGDWATLVATDESAALRASGRGFVLLLDIPRTGHQLAEIWAD
jgi:hypothetical protein